MSKGDNECFNCTKRHVGCHSTCQSYISFKKESERIREKKFEEKGLYNSLDFMSMRRKRR
jgi:hypothetical protein